jgi:hypothetical protein
MRVPGAAVRMVYRAPPRVRERRGDAIRSRTMPPSKWNAIPATFDKVQTEVNAMAKACTDSGDDEAKKAGGAVKSKFESGYKKHWESKGKNAAAKTDADKVVGPTLKTLYNTAYEKWKATQGPASYAVRLSDPGSPKFWHNASAQGKVPVWKFQWEDEDEGGTGDFSITMPDVGKNANENKQSELMNALALKHVKDKFPGATVKLK